MDRNEKITEFIELLDWENVRIIDVSSIQALIIDAEYNINNKESGYLQQDIIERGLIDEDINEFVKFLEKHNLMLISIDDIEGVSFENVEYPTDRLYASELFKENMEEASTGRCVNL